MNSHYSARNFRINKLGPFIGTLGRNITLWHNGLMSLEKIAIIDIGSNSMRLEIVSVRGDDFWTVARYKAAARIASGMYPGLVITPEAIDRGCRALRYFSRWIALHQADSVRCVATSAVRDALNQQEVVSRLTEALGRPIEILHGDREGWYSYFGVRNGFDEPEALIFDIGGGSAELIDVHKGKPQKILTLPLGAVRLSEMFFSNRSRPTASEWKKMESFILKNLEDSGLFDKDYPTLIGVGGTTRQLARMSQKIRKYPFYPDIHHYEIAIRDLSKLFKRVGRRLTAEQARTFNIGADRADILPAGLAVVAAIAHLSRAPGLTFSHYGLRQGLFMEYFLKKKENEAGHKAEESIRRIARRYGRYRDSRLLRQMIRNLVALLLPAQFQNRRISVLSEAIGAFAFLPVSFSSLPNTREMWSLLLHGELPGFSQKDRLITGLVLTLREDGTNKAKKRSHPYLRHLGNEDLKILKILSQVSSLAVEIVCESEGQGASFSYRTPVLHIVCPSSDLPEEHFSLTRTEERDLGLGHPVSIQWFHEQKESTGEENSGHERNHSSLP